ncbi:MAG TPA: hypothetical protein PLI09_27635 [Candidatus Hydrogenedentes bacterium]|nr:hypothetical protein [Candidatus Hydrogenedentota bacterium]
MNDRVKTYLKRLDALVDDLHTSLERSREQLGEAQDAHERLLKQYWSRGKEITTMKNSVKEFEALQEENQRLRDIHQEVQERTRTVLEYTKALSDELRRE